MGHSRTTKHLQATKCPHAIHRPTRGVSSKRGGARSHADACAQDILATITILLRVVRDQMRQHRRAELSVPQFRSLIYVHVMPQATLSDLAEHIGISLPAASRLVAGLVRRGLLRRQQRQDNRRCVQLTLTQRGREAYQSAHEKTCQAFTEHLTELPTVQLRLIRQAMTVLNRTFASPSYLVSNARPHSSTSAVSKQPVSKQSKQPRALKAKRSSASKRSNHGESKT
ncbi:MAG: MarR family winged helix-turn-helix transcriptional regulator [Phycisphaerae bacterium]|nr:MarR family winged helix-turn-helix transcriptional regulator [Phycisphaerae bacterium]